MAAFVSVVDNGSFSAAARTLGMSRSAISRQISTLEKAISTTLLIRTTRQIRLTPEGEAYYRRCQEVVELANQASRESSQRQHDIAGPLRVTAPMVSHRLMMPIIKDFSDVHPDVTIHLSYDDAYTDLVAAGIDVALRVGPTKDSTLRMRRLFAVQYAVCASPGYLRAYGQPKTPRDLANHRWITLSTLSNPHVRQFMKGGKRTNVRVKGALYVDTAIALRDALISGVGLSAFPLFYIKEELEKGQLIRLLSRWKVTESGFFILYPNQEFLPARTRAFINSVTGALAQK